MFFYLKTPDGGKELVTAPLDGTILPGVTRDCVLSLSREWGEFDVSERPYTIYEIIEALEQDRVRPAPTQPRRFCIHLFFFGIFCMLSGH